MKNNILIENINTLKSKPEKYSQFHNLYEDCLGKDIKNMKALENNNGFIATITSNDKLVAFFSFFIAQSESGVEQTIGNKKLKSPINYGCGICVLLALGVKKEERDKGKASALFGAIEDFLIEKKIDSIIGAAIECDGKIPAASLFEKFKYTKIERVLKAWEEECTAGEFCCQNRDKENNICRCNADVYFKNLFQKKH